MGQGGYWVQVWSMAACLAFASCATTSEVGNPCESDDECSSGLVCKGASCGPARSLRDGICVTDRGCADGLACMDGICSEGRADGAACASACANVGRLMMDSMSSEGAPPEAGAETGSAADKVQVVTFEMDCRRECEGQMSLARTRCMEALTHLDGLKDCP
ncbi:MAG: hypothetical protein VX938_01175 [Myxococcota bacterium]|nr:hypothetical protein [Myxococcota bacterium]MEE2779131.1 hypothetical protein [Myxococcota bacterium]